MEYNNTNVFVKVKNRLKLLLTLTLCNTLIYF